MEHRCSTRNPCGMTVTLDCPYHGPVLARAQDLSLDGIFIETGELFLPLNTRVHVAFETGGDERRTAFRLPGMIVRRARTGVGVMFLETNDATLGALDAALSEPAGVIAPRGPRLPSRARTEQPNRRAS